MKPNIFVVGYRPRRDVPLEDYPDFPIGRQFNWLELEAMTDQGVLPPGVILQARGGRPCVVVGSYGQEQSVKLLEV